MASTFTWISGTSGAWGVASNWLTAGTVASVAPGIGDIAFINAGSVTIAAGPGTTVADVTMQTIAGGSAGVLDVFGSLAVTATLTVTDGLLAALNGGTVAPDGATAIAAGTSNDVATIEASGANSLFEQAVSGINVGVFGAGLLEAINGGTIIQNGSASGVNAGVSLNSRGTILVMGTGVGSTLIAFRANSYYQRLKRFVNLGLESLFRD
jgi:hypothetical protein